MVEDVRQSFLSWIFTLACLLRNPPVTLIFPLLAPLLCSFATHLFHYTSYIHRTYHCIILVINFTSLIRSVYPRHISVSLLFGGSL